MGAIIVALLPVLLKLAEETPTLAGEVGQIWAFLTSNHAPTDDQQAQIDAALEKAHSDLQAS